MSPRSLSLAQQLLSHAGWEVVTCRVHDLLGPPRQEAAPWLPRARSTEQLSLLPDVTKRGSPFRPAPASPPHEGLFRQ